MVQNGDEITVTVSVGTREYRPFYGVMDGNTVNLKWVSAKGKMIVKPGGKELVGTVVYTGGSGAGTGNVELKLTKIESDVARIPDVSGTYMSEVTGPSFMPFKDPEVRLVQDGNNISGTYGSNGEIWGHIEGDTIFINWQATGSTGMNGKGKWTIKPDSKKFDGVWMHTYRGTGKWNLTKIE